MDSNHKIKGHLYACITILIWGTTFIMTKILLAEFLPIEILFYRFCIGLLVLIFVYPHRLKGTTLIQEVQFALAGFCGVTLYYLLENIALTHTSASNVGVIVSVAPFFTALLAKWFLDGESPNRNFYIGFVVAIVGIGLISFNGSSKLQLSPIGDLLTLLSAIVWACYSVLSRRISQFGYNTIQTTRRTFCYGLLFMIPALFPLRFRWGLERFGTPVNLWGIVFLGLGASALCFVTWNLAVKLLGAVKTSIYIYLVPVITIVTSVIVLKEKITWMSALGTGFALAGLFLSDRKLKTRSNKNEHTEYEMRHGN